jgi:F-type H+-transporting ATPase subunit a
MRRKQALIEESKTKKRWGTNRWIVLATIILGVIFAGLYPPVRPHIQVAPEAITGPLFGSLPVTNTIVAMLIGDVIIILVALGFRNAVKGGNMVLKGIPSAVETIFETLYNLTESTAGKHAGKIFPWFATIVMLVLVANWLEMLPGVDSIGSLHVAHEGQHGSAISEILPGVATIIPTVEEGAGEHGETYMLVPWVRVLSTDLNFTASLALIAVLMTQVIGVRAQGMAYFYKFLNVKHLFDKPFFGAMDFLVGLLETISELAKLLSFSFRLFGVMFAGAVLLFLIGTMIPVFMQSFILLFEFFMGTIQALVFGMLTMIFMTQATQGHGEHEEEH